MVLLGCDARYQHRHQMSAQGLVLCQDPQVLGILQPVLAETGIATTVCTGIASAQAMLSSDKFNPVIVDCDGFDSGTEFLESVRQSGPNFESIELALVRTLDGMRNAFAAGANLVLWKPVSKEEAARVVRATQGLSNRRRRRFVRLTVPALVYVTLEGIAEPVLLTELSVGGMGVQAFDRLVPGREVKLRFALPGWKSEITAGAEIAWADASGRAGLRFTSLTETARAAISDWLPGRGLVEPAALNPPRENLLCPLPAPLGAPVKQVLAALCDAVLVGGATALFGFVYYLVTRSLPSESATAVAQLGIFLLLWLAYRLVFFPDPVRSPGSLAAEHICGLYTDTGNRMELTSR